MAVRLGGFHESAVFIEGEVDVVDAHLVAQGQHPEFNDDLAQLFDSADAGAGASVPDEADGLVPPGTHDVVQRVLEHRGIAMVVLRSHEDIAVCGTDLWMGSSPSMR